jgi:Mg2+/Co2+ transporter CorC
LKLLKFWAHDRNSIFEDEELDVIGELISNMYGALEFTNK